MYDNKVECALRSCDQCFCNLNEGDPSHSGVLVAHSLSQFTSKFGTSKKILSMNQNQILNFISYAQNLHRSSSTTLKFNSREFGHISNDSMSNTGFMLYKCDVERQYNTNRFMHYAELGQYPAIGVKGNRRLLTSKSLCEYILEPKYNPITVKMSDSQSAFDVEPGPSTNTQSLLDSLEHINLQKPSLNFLLSSIDTLLKDAEIKNPMGFKDLIIDLIGTIGVSMDQQKIIPRPENFFKSFRIKNIPGGSPSMSEKYFGIALLKKNTHKFMFDKVIRPKILLISFPLEYSAEERDLTLIEDAIYKEHTLTNSIIAKIEALGIKIIFSLNRVSFGALRIFLKKGIQVMFNVKPSVMQILSKFTKTEIVESHYDLRAKLRFGTCSKVFTKTLECTLNNKGIMILCNNKSSSYLTMVLRGGTLQELSKVKLIIKTAVNLYYGLFIDSILISSILNIKKYVHGFESQHNITDSSSNHKLTQNPHFTYPKLTADDFLKAVIPLKRELYKMLSIPPYTPNGLGANQKCKAHSTTSLCELRYILPSENEIKVASNDGMIEKSISDTFKKFLLLDVRNKKLKFVYITRPKNALRLCRFPEYSVVKFYDESDCTLESYIKYLHKTARYICTCGCSMIDHEICYIHNRNAIVISMNNWIRNEGDISISPTLLAGNMCDLCNSGTVLQILSDKTKKCSLGKFMELFLYYSGLCSDTLEEHPIHSWLKHRKVIFIYHDLKVEFRLEPVATWKISFPSVGFLEVPNWIKKFENKKIKWICRRLYAYRRSVLSRLDHIYNLLGLSLDFDTNSHSNLKELKYHEFVAHIDENLALLKSEIKSTHFPKWKENKSETLEIFIWRRIAYIEFLLFSYVHFVIPEERPKSTEKIFEALYINEGNPFSSKTYRRLGIKTSPYRVIEKTSPAAFSIPGLFYPIGKELGSVVSCILNSKEYKEALSLSPANESFKKGPNFNMERASGGDMDDIYIEQITPKGKFECNMICARAFDAFRRTLGADRYYLSSLLKANVYNPTSGRSKSRFFETIDKKFIIKEMSSSEYDTSREIVPRYLNYMYNCIKNKRPTLLAKIFGIYSITLPSRKSRTEIIIIENLFFGKKTSRVFDLKGCSINRGANDPDEKDEILMDREFQDFMMTCPGVVFSEKDAEKLRAATWNDTEFLSSLNVMDYSVIAGIDSRKNSLTVGIVDFARTFTWDKMIESWAKDKALPKSTDRKEPTIVPPTQYKHRLRASICGYMIAAPSIYTEFLDTL